MTAQAQYNHIKRLVHTNVIVELMLYKYKKGGRATKLILTAGQYGPTLVELLTNYASVFSTPLGLPPQRDHNHSIPLV